MTCPEVTGNQCSHCMWHQCSLCMWQQCSQYLASVIPMYIASMIPHVYCINDPNVCGISDPNVCGMKASKSTNCAAMPPVPPVISPSPCHTHAPTFFIPEGQSDQQCLLQDLCLQVPLCPYSHGTRKPLCCTAQLGHPFRKAKSAKAWPMQLTPQSRKSISLHS